MKIIDNEMETFKQKNIDIQAILGKDKLDNIEELYKVYDYVFSK